MKLLFRTLLAVEMTLLTFLFVSSSAATSTRKKAATKDKQVCTATELKRQDCRLRSGDYEIRLLKETVTWKDGVWPTVENVPLVGPGTQWEKVRFELMKEWPILQLWIWDKGAGEAQVQSLHWFVTALEHRKLDLLAEGVVRKRRMRPLDEEAVGEAADGDGEGDSKAPPKFLFDAWETHGLKMLKDGRLQWSLGRENQILERANHGI
ncbi:MAG: hypothetical protein AB7G93_07535 [Bdellovibrionales bacterium]